MTLVIGIEEAQAKALGAGWTAAEIAQQPDAIRQTQAILDANRETLDAFLQPLLARPDLRIVLTGAGTSAFIGDSLAPLLSVAIERCVEAVATTDIVSVPQQCLAEKRPTLLVSFGRSGNSPESVAAIDLADQLLDEVYHLVITCNGEGALAAYAGRSARASLIQLPECTHDKSFAMTSSFSAMLYAAMVALGGRPGDGLDQIPTAMAAVRDRYADLARELGTSGFKRAVYLGSGGLQGVAREAALKLLEMTDGVTPAMFDTPLGFRHGPKAFLNGETLVVVFVSNNPYTRRYDLDLVSELVREKTAQRIIAVSSTPVPDLDPADQVLVPDTGHADDLGLLFAAVVLAQMIGVHHALALGKTPDDPNPSGIVNRVVQGVRIHAVA